MNEPSSRDRIFVCAVRLPAGEFPFMQTAMEEAADAMNATSGSMAASIPVLEVDGPDVERALRTLALWSEDLGL